MKLKKIGCIMGLMMTVLAFGSISDAGGIGEDVTKKGDEYREIKQWDYTDIIGDSMQMSEFEDSSEGYLANKGDRDTQIKLTVSTGENNRAKLKESANLYLFSDGTSGNGVVFSANTENPWEAGANISLDFARSEKAFFYYLTVELGFSGKAPRAWKLQVSYDNGKSYTDVKDMVAAVKKEGNTEVLFERISIPKPPYNYLDYLHAPDQDVYSSIPYRLRLSAISEKNDEWEGSTSGEVCIKKVSLGEWCATVDNPGDIGYPKETEKNQNQQVKKPVKQTKVPKPVLKIKMAGKKKISLIWKKINADGYEIYQKIDSGKFKKIKTLKVGKTKYVVKKMKQKTYVFKIRAFKGKGKSRVYSGFSLKRKVRMK